MANPIEKLVNGFTAAPGTHAVAIAGVLTMSPGRYDAKDILKGDAKMYAGVNGAVTNTAAVIGVPAVVAVPEIIADAAAVPPVIGVPAVAPVPAVKGESAKSVMTAPTKWVYRLTDYYTKSLENNRPLANVDAVNTAAALEMYAQIYDLATTQYKDINADKYKSLGATIPKGTNFAGQRFQLLFNYTPGDQAAKKAAIKAVADAEKAVADANTAYAAITADALKTAQTALAAASATINGTGYIRYGNDDENIKSFSVKDNKITAADDGSMQVLNLLGKLLDDTLDIETEGGKLSTKKRRMSFKKGGRNNSVSRKQNKKGGAKIRRSQKAGKRAR